MKTLILLAAVCFVAMATEDTPSEEKKEAVLPVKVPLIPSYVYPYAHYYPYYKTPYSAYSYSYSYQPHTPYKYVVPAGQPLHHYYYYP